MKVHYSSKTPEWSTPQALFDELNVEFSFTLDPCATVQNAKCAKFFTKRSNGLKKSWGGEVVFMNPPYGREISAWIKKAYEESLLGAIVVCLVPARTDTAWWHDYVMKAWPHDIRLLRGRLKFGDSKNAAPFPSAIIIFKKA